MSTLRVSAINNAAAGSGGLAISATGNVTGAGLDLVTSQSFTAASTVSVDNCFTTAYDEYLVLVKSLASVAGYVQIRLRASGVDEAGAVYTHQKIQATSTTVAGQSAGSQTSITSTFQVGTSLSAFSLDLFDPDVAGTTSFRGSGGYSSFAGVMAGHVATSTAYDGVTVYPVSGTITGTIRVYGYRK